jgi:predicted phage tail protein
VNPNTACRLCFLGLGVFLLVDGLSSALELLAQKPLVVSRDEVSLPTVLSSAGISVALSLGGATLFAFIPGALILWKASHWANRWFPAEEPSQSTSHSPSAYYAVGATLLGVYFVVVGASSFIGGVAQVISLWATDNVLDNFHFSHASNSLASGAAYIVGGLWLTIRARRAAA